MNIPESLNRPGFYLHTAVMVAIILFFRVLTPPAGLTEEGLAVIGIFFGILYGWLFIDVVWPSMFGLVVLGLSLERSMDAVLGSAFSNSTVLLLLFFCMVASIINSAGISEWVARKIVSVPFIVGRPFVLVFMLCLSMCALATMLTMTSAILVALPLMKEVCRQYGYKPGDVFPMLVMIAMIYAGEIAYMMLPFKSLPAIVFGIYGNMSGGATINLAAYVFIVFVLLILSLIFVILLYKYIIKPDVTPILQSKDKLVYNEKLTPYQRHILWSFVLLIVVMLLPNILPRDFFVTQFLRKMGNNGLLLTYVFLYLFISFKDGIKLKEIMNKSVTWPALFLVIAVLEISGAFDKSGVSKWIAEISQPILADVNGYTLVFIIIFLATAITQLVNNNACAATFAPIAYTLSMANSNIQPEAVMTCLILSCTLGLATPASSTVAAIAYGDEWIEKRTMFKYATVFWLFNVALLSTIGYMLCKILY